MFYSLYFYIIIKAFNEKIKILKIKATNNFPTANIKAVYGN